MTRAAQPSILSFFNKQQPPKYAAPPSQSQGSSTPPSQPQESSQTKITGSVPPAPPPPPPPTVPQPFPTSSKAALPDLSTVQTLVTSPHPSATIVPVTASHIPALRRINALLLPVNYSDSFYQGILDPSVSGLFSRAILWQDDPSSQSPPKVVGGLICRLEPSSFDPSTGRYNASLAPAKAGKTASVAPPRIGQGHALYIQSLVLLSPYRGLGLVNAALDGIFDAVKAVGRDPRKTVEVKWVYAHVWSANEEGLGWYQRRGFEKDVLLDKYYWKLQPDSAWIVKRMVDASGRDSKIESNGQGSAEIPASVTAAAVNLPEFAPPAGVSPPLQPTPNGPTPPKGPPRPQAQAHSLSFQNKRPDMEWNDLPEEMVTSKNSSRSDLLAPPSGSSSRSSSTGRKKKDRAYPTAAFGA